MEFSSIEISSKAYLCKFILTHTWFGAKIGIIPFIREKIASLN